MKHNKITFTDDNYPEALKKIFNPPCSLYVIGDANVLNQKAVAIIGSRKCSKYGMEMARKIAYKFAKNNICIVSGLARGIDTYSHIGCLQAGGKTVAVLGSGFNNIYPAENIGLAKKIVENGGAIVTEYESDEKPLPINFPKRNRIISGLVSAVIVIEATKRSGTSITVDFALEQGKDVYALPGDINRITSYGTNELINEGAIPIIDIDTIIDNIKL